MNAIYMPNRTEHRKVLHSSHPTSNGNEQSRSETTKAQRCNLTWIQQDARTVGGLEDRRHIVLWPLTTIPTNGLAYGPHTEHFSPREQYWSTPGKISLIRMLISASMMRRR